MNEMNKTRKKRLMYINILTVSILCLAVFGQVYFSATKLFAKEPLSLTLVEEKVSENQTFHLDISDTRGVEELNRQVELEVPQPTIGEETDSVENEPIEIKRELKLLIPEGITFDAEAEKAMLQESDELEELPVFSWNESGRLLTISMDVSQTDIRVLLTADISGEYTFELSDTVNQIEPQQLNLTVEGEQAEADASAISRNLTRATDATTGLEDISQYDPATVRDVSNWEELIRALGDTSIAGINITSGFAVPANPRANLTTYLTGGTNSNTSGTSQYVYMGMANIGRKVVIEGNNNTIDFGAIALCFYNTTGVWDFTWQNLDIYHGNIYGFTTLNDLSAANQRSSKMTYANIRDVGSQMIHSPYTDVVLKGSEVSTLQQSTYTSPYRTDWRTDGDTQINFFITNLTVSENTKVSMSTLRAGNIHLLSGGSLIMKKNSEMNIIAGQNDLTGEGDAYQTNIFIAGGNLSLEDGAQLNLAPKPNYAALSLYQANSNVTIGENAKLSINSNGHTDSNNYFNRNIVYLAPQSSLVVDKKGTLDINAQGMGSSNSNIIHVAGNATFTVQKQGSFSVVSDSTSQSQNLIYFGSNGSTFQFADAQIVNLERTASLSGTATTNGLINIAGNGGKLNVDIQRVSMWERENFSDTPTASWTPMYGMLLTYSSYTPTITTAESLDQSISDDFKNNFTTRNVQRVLYEYIPDVNVAFTSTATDEVDSPNSTTITGVTNPGAYVRLSDEPINTTVTPTMDPSDDSILSPVTSATANNPAFTNNFTVQADSSGNFSYTVPAGNHFAADSTIYAYSFLNGKYDEATQIVLDKTPPSGEPKDFYAGMGEAVPDPSVFVQNPTDTNPTPQTFTYEYSDKNDAAELEALMGQIGTHIVYVNLLDEAGNKTEIASNLIILETSQAITGASFDAPYLDIRDLSDTELIQYILDKSKPEAYSIVDGVKTDISSLVTVTDFGGLNDIANIQPKEYTVTLTVKAADSGLAQDITSTIKVTVVDVDAVLTVEFINELGQVLPGYTITIDSQVGDKIDLTKEERVTKQLTDLESAGYEIAERPDNETEVVINNTEVTVRYKLQGILSLASAPNALDFGSLTYNATTKRVDDPSIDQPLIVTDTRADTANGWTLTASLSTPMRNTEGQELVNALRYVYRGKETILDTNAQTVFLNANGSAGSIDISNSWGSQTGTDGVKLQIESSDIVHTGNYVGVITWKVMAGQP